MQFLPIQSSVEEKELSFKAEAFAELVINMLASNVGANTII
jgi:hypothetical protein